MPNQLVECIPNFSEGRRQEVVDAIHHAIQAVPNIHVLDQHSDHDHNRTVITFVGPAKAVADAAFAGMAKAAELIDLDHHQGEHPRIGATDVVPFVPISGITQDDCIALARSVAERAADELGLPIYLYEAAATRPDRVNLENIRRGEYEGLIDAIQTDAERAPDFGPAELGPAGATVIGVRAPLIAYNVYLSTEDVGIAKKIARAIRHSSGGLRFVKSIGLLVDGRAQVSMNLTDFTKTPIARVVETIRREAERYGVGIHHSELVGLAPQASLIDAARWYLQMDQFEPDQILETRLFDAREEAGDSSETFLDRLASGNPTPGGGSAAAHVGATAAALVAMVGRVTAGKKKYAEVEERMKQVVERAEALRADLSLAVERDAAAFDAFMAALKLPKGTEEEKASRAAAIETATHGAASVPLDVARMAIEVLKLAAEMAETGNTNAASDAGAGAAMATAAFEAAGLNVRINALGAKDQSAVTMWLNDLEGLETEQAELNQRVQAALKKRAGL
jgi:glutamate formiminotransferase/formiminotetrahydrofolate cyclodeaminase